MDSERTENQIHEFPEIHYWKMVTLVIGWIGLMLSMVGMPFYGFLTHTHYSVGKHNQLKLEIVKFHREILYGWTFYKLNWNCQIST